MAHRLHPAFQSGYELDLEIFKEEKFSVFQIPYPDSPLFSVKEQVISLFPSLQDLEALKEVMRPSLVGKGSSTIYDEKIRKSIEILVSNAEEQESEKQESEKQESEKQESEEQEDRKQEGDSQEGDNEVKAVLDPKFFSALELALIDLSKPLRNGGELRLIPYKIVLYEAGSHFGEHIDAVHHQNMIMTLSVEIGINSITKGGRLILNGKKTSKLSNSNSLGLALFYTDVLHSITRVREGHRLSLICDIIQTSTLIPNSIPESDRVRLSEFIEIARKRGATSIAIPSSHLYQADDYSEIELADLKGRDHLVAQLFDSIDSHRLIPITYFDETGHCVREEVFEICSHLVESISELYHRDYEEEEDGDEEEIKFGIPEERRLVVSETFERKVRPISEFQPFLDKKNIFQALSSEYLLGGMAFIVSGNGLFKRTHRNNASLYLGNEGFEGNIYNNLAIVLDI